MGCLKSKEKEDNTPTELPQSQPKQVDPRLPFDNYRQVFNLKNSWKAVSRCMEDTAKECLIRYFRLHPEHRELHRGLANLDDEEKMRESTSFLNAAMSVFNTFDDVMESIEKVDMALVSLEMAGKAHCSIPGFSSRFIKDMQEPFLQSVASTLGDRFTEATEQNFRKLFQFVSHHMIVSLGGDTEPELPESSLGGDTEPQTGEESQFCDPEPKSNDLSDEIKETPYTDGSSQDGEKEQSTEAQQDVDRVSNSQEPPASDAVLISEESQDADKTPISESQAVVTAPDAEAAENRI